MTNQEKLKQINERLDNPEGLGLLEHFDLVLNQLPSVKFYSKYRPDTQWSKSKDEINFERGLLNINVEK